MVTGLQYVVRFLKGLAEPRGLADSDPAAIREMAQKALDELDEWGRCWPAEKKGAE